MSLIGNQNIFGLQIPVVNPNGMTILDGIQDLEEHMLGQSIVAHKTALLSNIGEQVALGTIFDYDKCAIGAIQNAHHGNHIGMLAGLVMQSDFPTLEALLSRIQSMFGECLNSIEVVGAYVDSLVNNTVRSDSEDGDKLESIR